MPYPQRSSSSRPNSNPQKRRAKPSRPTTHRKGDSTSAKAPTVVVPTLGEIAPDNAFVALGVPEILAQVLAGQGITEAFPIQEATLPSSLAGTDVLGQGRTGSGKTLAFSLPLVARLMANPQEPMAGRPRALVVVPTRELATQVAAVIEPLAGAVGMRVVTVFGGVSHGYQRTAFRDGVEIVVACPGRLLDHMTQGDVKLDRIETTVLDEADHMADQGFLPMVRRILQATPSGGQRLLFSATLANGVDELIKRYLVNPVSHAVATEAPVLLDHEVFVVSDAERQAAIANLARQGRTVIFTRTKSRAKQLAKKLDTAGLGAVEMHGNLSQNARERNLAAFSNGTARVLVCTDIAARGIHVDDVPLVVHADPPVEHKAYTHRSGRTARAGAAGKVITIATPDQVAEVRSLLKAAGVTATWTGIQIPVGVTAPKKPISPRSHSRHSPRSGGGQRSGGTGKPSGAGRPSRSR